MLTPCPAHPPAPPRRSHKERRLAAEVERLERKVEALEMALYGADRSDMLVPCTGRQRAILDAIMHATVITGARLHAALEAEFPTVDGRTSNIVAVNVYRLRAMLAPHGIEIRSSKGGDYWIEPEGKAALRRAFGVAKG